MDSPCPVEKRFELGYMQWHYDADRRHKAGERQRFCKTCMKWRWKDQEAACDKADTISAAEFERHAKECERYAMELARNVPDEDDDACRICGGSGGGDDPVQACEACHGTGLGGDYRSIIEANGI